MTITVNKDLAVQAMSAIETMPQRHEQASWRYDTGGRVGRIEQFHDDPLNPECQTAFCFAGWVATLDKAKWVVNRQHDSVSHLVANPDTCTCPPEQRYCNCGNYMTVGRYAQERLGLDEVDADALFASENTVEALRIGVKAIMNDESPYAVMRDAGCWDDEQLEAIAPIGDDD